MPPRDDPPDYDDYDDEAEPRDWWGLVVDIIMWSGIALVTRKVSQLDARMIELENRLALANAEVVNGAPITPVVVREDEYEDEPDQAEHVTDES